MEAVAATAMLRAANASKDSNAAIFYCYKALSTITMANITTAAS
jgi:hypothetical protein